MDQVAGLHVAPRSLACVASRLAHPLNSSGSDLISSNFPQPPGQKKMAWDGLGF